MNSASVQPDFIEEVDEEIIENDKEVAEEPKKISMQQETVPILHPQKLFSRIQPQEKKYWHFKFSNAVDGEALKQAIEHMEGVTGVTATYNYGGQKHPDIHITRNMDTIGKIHFLHFDRRDRGIKSKYYVKIYFFEFTDATMFEKIKQIVIQFFNELRDRTPARSVKSTKSVKKSMKRSMTRKNRSIRRSKN